MVTELVPPVERHGAAWFRAGKGAASVLFHVSSKLAGTAEGGLTAMRTRKISLTGRLRLAADDRLAGTNVLRG
jgi:hypothetical protein